MSEISWCYLLLGKFLRVRRGNGMAELTNSHFSHFAPTVKFW